LTSTSFHFFTFSSLIWITMRFLAAGAANAVLPAPTFAGSAAVAGSMAQPSRAMTENGSSFMG